MEESSHLECKRKSDVAFRSQVDQQHYFVLSLLVCICFNVPLGLAAVYLSCRAIHLFNAGDYKLILSTRDGWAELHNLITDQSEEINLKEQMLELYEKLQQEHENWQKENLKVKPMWPRIMDKRFHSEDGKEYFFPA